MEKSDSNSNVLAKILLEKESELITNDDKFLGSNLGDNKNNQSNQIWKNLDKKEVNAEVEKWRNQLRERKKGEEETEEKK